MYAASRLSKYTNNLLIAVKTTNPQDGFPEGRLSKIKKHIKNNRLLSPPEGHIYNERLKNEYYISFSCLCFCTLECVLAIGVSLAFATLYL